MPTKLADSLFVILTIVVNVATVVTVGGALGLRRVPRPVRAAALPAAAAITAVATAGSLYLSEVQHYLPCPLCWYQRVCMYPLAVLFVIAALRRDRGVWRYTLPLATIGVGVSSWHLLVERFPTLESSSCQLAVPCTIRWINAFGIITIPYMAASAFLAAIVASVVLARTERDDGPSRAAADGRVDQEAPSAGATHD